MAETSRRHKCNTNAAATIDQGTPQKPPNSSADDEDAQPSSPKKDDPQQLLLVEIPTENRFSALDDSYQEPSVSTPPANPPIVNTQLPPPTNRPITTQNNSHTLPDNVTLRHISL